MNWLLLNLCDSHLYFYSTIWRKNCFLVTLSLSPSVHIFLPMNYWMKRDVYISMCPINVNCLQLCIICILLLMYILYICIYMCDLLFQEAWSMKNRKAMNIYEQWTIMKVIIYFICLRSAPPDEILIAVNICWQKKNTYNRPSSVQELLSELKMTGETLEVRSDKRKQQWKK